MHLPGGVRVSHALRRLRSRVRPGVAILGYHRVCAGAVDPLGLSVAPEHFEAHLDAVARLGRPMRLADAAAAIDAGRVPRRAIVVTFDDGYADNLHTVLPLLEKYRVPATMFVTSGSRGGEFWWDRLVRLNAGRDGCVAGTGDLAAELERLSESEREERLSALERRARGDPRPLHRSLTAEELGALASSPLVEIGAHTASHEALTALPVARQRDETRLCRMQLEAAVGRSVTSFAYPHGAFTAETIEIVRDAGFTIACCSKYDVAAVSAPPLALPRLWVADHNGTRFARWLKGWFHG